ncbi:MAG: hypothetical protein CML29_17985 [Rhizobiales bacterium]|nr:hypothetical protein [Hyphomicrobiales bacterium]MBA69617.1 hypothetical protein [Hyphomicrobiales bacterium]
MIVFCHLLNDRSGSPRVLCGAIEALETPGRNILYVGSQGRGLLERTPAMVRRYWYHRSRHRLVTLFSLLVSQVRLYFALSRDRDIPAEAIVYMNTLLPFGAALWAKFTRRRLICHVHEVSISPGPLRWFLTAIAARTSDLLIYVSKDHLERLPIPGGRPVVLPNAISPALEAKGRATPFAGRRSGTFEVLMLASARDFKGVPEFLELGRMLADRDDIAFTLVLNADEKEVEHYLAGRPLAPNVRVLPETDDPSPFYAIADLVLNLSRVDLWVETFGLTLVEAMSFGVPVIAPPVGGPAEIVTDGVEGFLIDSREIGALDRTVRRLADDPALCQTMSAAARRKAESFSQEAFARTLQGFVRSLQDKGARP